MPKSDDPLHSIETPHEGGSISGRDAFEIMRLRYWQHLLNEMLKRREFTIPIHLAFGHEAVAVALYRCVGPDDTLCLSHRNVAHNLVHTKSLNTVLTHYRLIQVSNRAGLMGSMNLAIGPVIAYASSILGNDLPVAAGIAMNRSLVNKPGIVFVLTGDGAMEEGTFWETAIFARTHKLPLVIVVENDNHSMSSTIAQRRSEIDLSQVCGGIGLRYHRAVGAAFLETQRAISAARHDASEGHPACIELHISTLNQHAGPTPGWPDDPLRVALEDGLIIKNTPEDPVYSVLTSIGNSAFERIAAEIMKADASEQYLH